MFAANKAKKSKYIPFKFSTQKLENEIIIKSFDVCRTIWPSVTEENILILQLFIKVFLNGTKKKILKILFFKYFYYKKKWLKQ
jgi:hypothetical protein